MELRPYQLRTLETIQARLLVGVNRQLVRWPTGAGKTVLFSNLPKALGFCGRMLVLVHRDELAQQAVDKLRKWNPGKSVGLEMAGSQANDSQFVVASVQTLGRVASKRIEKFTPEEFDAVVIDEAHRSCSKSYRAVLDHFRVFEDKRRLLLGLTATVNRADGKGLGEIFQEIVYDMSILEAIRKGWLVDLKGIRISTSTNLDGVHTVAGDFDQKELTGAVNTPARNDLVVRSWLEHGRNRQTVAYAVDVQHALGLADAFRQYGIAAEAIWGDDPERKIKLESHRRCDLRVLVNCMILTEGYDDWRIGCIVFARPTKSETLYTQIVGRGSRIPEDINNLAEARERGDTLQKEDCILIDVVDVTSKHSLVSLPTLFGLHPDMDLHGKSVAEIMAQVDQVRRRRPYADLSSVAEVEELGGYAEDVDLFRIRRRPQIIQFSQSRWYRQGTDRYVLLLRQGESVVVSRDLLGSWRIAGWVNGNLVEGGVSSLREAIRWADASIERLGGATRSSPPAWRLAWYGEAPTKAQLGLCRFHGITVPIGATGEQVQARLNKVLDKP
jgi:ATP-dependent helicase IRC3